MGPAEITAGIQSLRLAFDMAKGLKDIADAAERNSKIVELQSIIMEAQAGAIQAQQSHAADVQRIATLEGELARLKAWEADKQRYELTVPSSGAVVYALKADSRNGEPPHWLCGNCYTNGKKSFLAVANSHGRERIWLCPACSAAQTIPYGVGPQ